MEKFKEFKNKKVEDVIDEIKMLHPVIRITYPKAIITEDFNENRLNINCDVHGYIVSFNWG